MRVGLVLNSFLRGEGIHAGGHVHSLEVAERWLAGSDDVTIFAPSFVRDLIRERLPRARFIAMPTVSRLEGSRITAFLARASLSFLRRADLASCDAIYATSPTLADVAPFLFVRRPARAVFIAHVLEAPWRRRGSLLWNAVASAAEWTASLIVNRTADTVVTCSRYVAAQLSERGFRRAVAVTTNGTDHLSPTIESRVRAGALCIGRLHPSKGVDDLIRAWKRVTDAVPGEVLTIVGDGDPAYRTALERLRDMLGLRDLVRFAGHVSANERDSLLARSILFASTSHEEGWGISVAEALAAGTPCVTYDLPVFREVFPGGRLVAPLGDARAFAARTIELLSDGALRERLSAEARVLAEGFTWERAAEIERLALVRACEGRLRS